MSTLGGPIRAAAPYLTGAKTVQDFTNDAMDGTVLHDLARNFLPGVGLGEALTGWGKKWPSKAPQLLSGLASIVGAYPVNDESAQQAWIENLIATGMKRFRAERQHMPR